MYKREYYVNCGEQYGLATFSNKIIDTQGGLYYTHSPSMLAYGLAY